MKRMVSAVCVLAVCSLPALAQKMTDQQFVNMAAQTDMVEANLGQLAQTSGSAANVKAYGQELVTDHTQDFGQLSTAAQQAGLTVPTAIDSAHNKAMIDPFQKLQGTAFDKKYLQEMIAGHTKAIAVYKKEANDAQNPSIKSYAQTALPVLQKHLGDAQAVQKSQ
jgi:putative membrane protein